MHLVFEGRTVLFGDVVQELLDLVLFLLGWDRFDHPIDTGSHLQGDMKEGFGILHFLPAQMAMESERENRDPGGKNSKMS